MNEIKEENPLQELLNAFISSLEPLEARSEAVYQFLKVKGGASDKDLAPFLEQAANASNVRWRAFRVRAEALIAGAMKDLEKQAKAKKSEPESESQKAQATESEKAESQDDAKATEAKGQTDETVAAKNPAKNESGPEADKSKSQTGEGKVPSQAKGQAKDQPRDTAASKPEAQQKNASVQPSRPEEPTARGKSTTEGQSKEVQSNEARSDEEQSKKDSPKKSAA